MPINDLSRVPREWPNRQFSHSVSAAGLNWHFLFSQHQSSSAKTILLIHGTGSSSHSWEKIFPKLAKEHTVIAIDLPGHGFTQNARKSDLHIDVIAKSLQQLLKIIDCPPINVMIGHSAGANCALALSLANGSPPEAIIGLNPSFVPPPSSYNFFVGPLINPIVTSGFLASFLANTIPMTGMIDKLLDSTNSILTEKQRVPYRLLFKEQSHIYGSMNFMAASNIPQLLSQSTKLKTQYYYLVAAQDPWVSQNALLPIIHQYFPQAKTYIENGGHLFHEENHARALTIILEILAYLPTHQPSENA
jgi:magnesium chelatase accessory protein